MRSIYFSLFVAILCTAMLAVTMKFVNNGTIVATTSTTQAEKTPEPPVYAMPQEVLSREQEIRGMICKIDESLLQATHERNKPFVLMCLAYLSKEYDNQQKIISNQS